MSTVRIVPLGVPLAVGISLSGYTALMLFSLVALLVTLLAASAIRRAVQTRRSAEDMRR